MRLAVILVQQAPAGAAGLAESLVGNLIGRPGLDLTLVNRFDGIADDSTDRMTLESVGGHAAVLDWHSPVEIARQLEAIGFEGQRWPHPLDPIDPSAESVRQREPPRKLFLFDLNAFADPNRILAELTRLRESLSVRTVSLDTALRGKSIGTSPSPANDRRTGNPTLPREQSETAEANDAGVNLQSDPVRHRPRGDSVPETTDRHLDALIDQLDDLDV